MNIRKGHTHRYIIFTLMSMAAGLGGMGVVYMINRIVDTYFSPERINFERYFIFFVIAVLIYMGFRWLVAISITAFTQDLLLETKTGVLQMVLRSSWSDVASNQEKIWLALTRDSDQVVSAAASIVDILTNGAIVLICFIYMGILSWQLLICMLFIVTITIFIYYVATKRNIRRVKKSMLHQDVFVKYLGEILGGFKEIAVERKKGFDIASRHTTVAMRETASLQKKVLVSFLNNRITGMMAFYIFIGALLFFLSHIFDVHPKTVVNFIFLILYMYGPLESIVLMIPGLTQANLSLKRINQIEEQMARTCFDPRKTTPIKSFGYVHLKGIFYQYEEAGKNAPTISFHIGPLDFSVKNGEVIFISGGNGSGKTTLMNILIGLVSPNEGEIFVDNRKIEQAVLPDYHSLFATVFSDFHLFDELYGLELADAKKAEEYISIFELEDKVSFDGRKFSSTDLSTGQRKRLALICAMLEAKPILILDEFAADQDPQFKKKFYTEIIPFLRREGFTIVAITHDDNYYWVADKVFKMYCGGIEALSVERDRHVYLQ